MRVLIDADRLRERLAAGERLRLLDVRWQLGVSDPERQFEAGHLPGAVYVDLERELAEPGLPAQEGRHPMPTLGRLQESARRWGLDDGDVVVVYDDNAGMSAARAWWLLRWAGVEEVYLLDGGLGAWTSADGALETGPATAEPGGITLSAGHMPTIDIDEAAGYPASGILLDARAAERYAGEVEPVDPKAGHIPGALSAPTSDNVGPDGAFLGADELRRRFEALGAGPDADVAVYCGSGVTAAHEIAALMVAGVDAALYPGSWSQWSNQPDRPVATGAAS